MDDIRNAIMNDELGAIAELPVPESYQGVVVRADEIVRGRARLHERTGDTSRSAASLRHATTARVRRTLALPGATPAAVVAREAERHLGSSLPPGLLDGPPPPDGEGLLQLARDLAALEDRVRQVGRDGRAGWTP